MTQAGTDNGAAMEGFTRHVMIEGGCASFAALVRPDEDFDSRFRAFDTDNQEWVRVNGWNCEISDLEDVA